MEKEILHYYVDKKMSVRAVAAKLRVGGATVRKVLKAHNATRSRAEACKMRSSCEKYREKMSVTQIGSKNSSGKLKEEQVIAIRAEYPTLLNSYRPTAAQTLLAERYKVSRGTVSDIVHRRTWKHI